LLEHLQLHVRGDFCQTTACSRRQIGQEMAEMGARTDDGRAKYLVLPMIVASASLATGMSKLMRIVLRVIREKERSYFPEQSGK